MRVVAVIQLDKQPKPDEKTSSDTLQAAFVEQISVLKQCNSINKWVFTASVAFAAQLSKHVLDEFAVKITDEWDSDPLTDFYQVVQRNLGKNSSNSANTLVLRLILNGASPNPATIDAMVENHLQQRHHYSRNQRFEEDASAPLIEIMNFEVLDEACREALLPDDRLHITPYIYRQQQRLSVGFYSTASEILLSA